MKNRVFAGQGGEQQPMADVLRKETSLQNLKDALQAERYEDCAALVQNAKRYGAGANEINSVIATSIRRFKPRRNEANVNY